MAQQKDHRNAAQALDHLPGSCVALSKVLNLREPQFLHLQNGDASYKAGPSNLRWLF